MADPFDEDLARLNAQLADVGGQPRAGIGSDRAADRRPRAPAEVLDQIPFANALAGGVAMMTTLPRMAHTMVREGINTADRWLSATHQLPGAKPQDDLVLPVEQRGTENYSLNPNRLEDQDYLSPLGLASMGNPVSALGRETLRAGAKVGRPSESYSPSLGDRAMAKYLDLTQPTKDGFRIDGTRAKDGGLLHPTQVPVDPGISGGFVNRTGKLGEETHTDFGMRKYPEVADSAHGLVRRANKEGALNEATNPILTEESAKKALAHLEALKERGPANMPGVPSDRIRAVNPDDYLLSDAGKRSSLPGMIQGAFSERMRA